MKHAAFMLVICAVAGAADYRAGVGRIDITPDGPIWLSGYASRKKPSKPSEGVMHRLWAKALAIEDNKGSRAVIVTTDVLGIPRQIADVVGARVEKQYGLERSRLLLNSSHTHTGPVIRPNLRLMYDLDEPNWRAVENYAEKFTTALVNVIGAALADLSPAQVSYGTGSTGFAVNRRQFSANGVRIGVNPSGSVDHSVPVLRIAKTDGSMKAVIFGYACHNTTMTGEHYVISGDYAGQAQIDIEQAHPGSSAMFLMLCGADQNPNPRSQVEHVKQHGGALAKEVDRILKGKLDSVKGTLRAALQLKELPLSPHTRETFEQMQSDKDVYRQRLSKEMLRAYDERRPIRTVTYPVQALRLGNNLAIVALGGEVVVDYALWAKREFPKKQLIVAGYSNDVMCYIPTAKILQEGGYEAVQSMVYYGQPTPFMPEVEEIIHQSIRTVLKRVGF
jgi:neutral ceramidase